MSSLDESDMRPTTSRREAVRSDSSRLEVVQKGIFSGRQIDFVDGW